MMTNYRHSFFFGDNFYGITKVKPSMIYTALVQKSFVPPLPRNKFSQKFNISEEDWPKIYSPTGKCSIDSKTRIFQYKILNNALYFTVFGLGFANLKRLGETIPPTLTISSQMVRIYYG